MAKNKLSNLIASVQMLNIGIINNDNKYTTKLEIGGGGYPVNYQSFLSNLFSLAPLQLFFLCKLQTKYCRLLRVSFIELREFIIYQHLNRKTKILPLATSQIVHLCNQFNYVYTANFYATF